MVEQHEPWAGKHASLAIEVWPMGRFGLRFD
jgi:hypothetical protein